MEFFQNSCSIDFKFSTMPLSEEFAEIQFTAESLNISQYSSQMGSSSNFGCFGCFNSCTGSRVARNSVAIPTIRDKLLNKRRSLVMPEEEQVAKFIKYIVMRLQVEPANIKTVVLTALILIEKIITKSQHFSNEYFRGSSREQISEILGPLITPTQNYDSVSQDISE
jgi:hypothetical protein